MRCIMTIDCRFKTYSNQATHACVWKQGLVPAPYEFHCASVAQLAIVTRIREASKELTIGSRPM